MSTKISNNPFITTTECNHSTPRNRRIIENREEKPGSLSPLLAEKLNSVCEGRRKRPLCPSSPPPTPKKYYPANEEGKFILSPTAAKASRVIYVIHNKSTGERYVGKTEQELRERLYSHHFGITHPEKEVGQKKLYEDIRENPENFEIGILQAVDENEDIFEVEKALIAEKNAYHEGYNQTEGGGSQKTGSGMAVLPEQVPTPKKYYPLSENKMRFEFSPTTAKIKKLIYVIYDQKHDKRYVGKTEQELRQRFYSHHFNISHPDKENGDSELYRNMRERPQDFFAGVLYQPPGEEDDLEVLEAYLIEQKNSYGNGYNRTRGVPIDFNNLEGASES